MISGWPTNPGLSAPFRALRSLETCSTILRTSEGESPNIVSLSAAPGTEEQA